MSIDVHPWTLVIPAYDVFHAIRSREQHGCLTVCQLILGEPTTIDEAIAMGAKPCKHCEIGDWDKYWRRPDLPTP